MQNFLTRASVRRSLVSMARPPLRCTSAHEVIAVLAARLKVKEWKLIDVQIAELARHPNARRYRPRFRGQELLFAPGRFTDFPKRYFALVTPGIEAH